MIRRTIAILIFTGFYFILSGQEILSGLQINEAVKQKAEKMKATAERQDTCACREGGAETRLTLPFFDDFSTSSVYPDTEKWDKVSYSVFVNPDFPLFPPNHKAATFDAIDYLGKVYQNADWIPFKADELRSLPIRLDSVFTPVVRALTPADSVYFSFFYQPQGVGDKPEPWDTLILEFSYPTGDSVFSHIDSIWVPVSMYLSGPSDTLRPGDTVYAPGADCNPDIYMINFQTLTWDDYIEVPCDSVFAPEIVWDKAWESEGMRLDTFRLKHGGKYFVQKMIRIDSAKYFTDKFSFRFRNYASIANDIIPSWRSNVDQWNVDYVYLNYDRSIGDTTYRMLTFSQRAPSFLKDYEVMPYRQYKADAPVNVLKPDFKMYISNMDKIEHNTNYLYRVSQVNGTFGYTYNGGNCNLPPFYDYGFQRCTTSCGAAHACPPVQMAFNFDVTRDTTSYLIKHYISDSSQANILVDSVIYRQGFYNYYAYDDGTPEFGYGLEPAGSLLAYQFSLSMPDTLWGVQIYFNRTMDNANQFFFDLNVYQDNNGKPGDIIYTLPNQEPKWRNGLYYFYTYMFDEPVLLSGTFYVGWQQYASGSLNVGFDANSIHNNKIFYKVQTEWKNSIFPGSLLIRPIVGQKMVLSTEENVQSENQNQVRIYPNPAQTWFMIDPGYLEPDPEAQVALYNIYGSLIMEQTGTGNRINVSALPGGMYLVRVMSRNKIYTGKILIHR
ncbi:MAG: T9SS type A sorting domain-containing protein [Chlorobi bacterium]|nr:T9SS type A sorting domain-containing protein [Chlorobiota bacterium]